MSLNGGWRRIKIVEPKPSRAQEISGGIKNALDRGEPLEKAKQSFISSGYTPEEVQEAVQLMGPQSAKPLNPDQSGTAAPAKKSSKKIIIITAITITVILVAALAIGLFWDRIF